MVDLPSRPAALELILQHNAESSFSQAPFDAFSKFIHSTLFRVATDARFRGGTYRFQSGEKGIGAPFAH